MERRREGSDDVKGISGVLGSDVLKGQDGIVKSYIVT